MGAKKKEVSKKSEVVKKSPIVKPKEVVKKQQAKEVVEVEKEKGGAISFDGFTEEDVIKEALEKSAWQDPKIEIVEGSSPWKLITRSRHDLLNYQTFTHGMNVGPSHAVKGVLVKTMVLQGNTSTVSQIYVPGASLGVDPLDSELSILK